MHTTDTERAASWPFQDMRFARRARAPGRGLLLAGWLTTGLFAGMMTVSGVAFVVAPGPVVEMFGHLGYPLYFARLLGVAKLLGVAALLAPRVGVLREWAFAGFTFVFVAAVLSHALSGDGAGRAAPAALSLGLLLGSYFLRRRAARAPEDGRS